MINQKFCPNCNKPVLDEEQTCPNCGAILDITTEKTPLVSKALDYSKSSLTSEPVKPKPEQQLKPKIAQKTQGAGKPLSSSGKAAREKYKPNIQLKKSNDKTVIVLIIIGAAVGLLIGIYLLTVISGDTGNYKSEVYNSKEVDTIDMQYSILDHNFKTISNVKFWILTKGELSRAECEEIRNRIATDLTTPTKAISYMQSNKIFQEWRQAGAGLTLIFTTSSYNFTGYLTLEFNIGF